MTSLHTLNQAPSNASLMQSCLSSLQPDDTLLLIEDGVYWLLDTHRAKFPIALNIKALRLDAQARGLLPLVAEVDLIEMDEFVHLSVTHDKIVSWF
ncbi:sulfurtransferase complex subunit TusB [Nitrincola nitratireducens]|uniref:Sulfur transfer complex subunit TusB n=1 Tax=Nitrincola nitratireducens TaxID=1229521 RepID=W9UVW7_9GAMM|nr:sulfurtransferase complex subunit TusB [Nitrincola nitratireducens]EXJ11373.1 sulfur transfer complex subunit TusB [Nitrincola nitratireducens]